VKRASFHIYKQTAPVIFVILAIIADGSDIYAAENPKNESTSQQGCMWTADAQLSLDSTYRWHGLYLGGVERSITVIVKGTTISVQEKNARAIDGLDYNLKLTDGQLDTSRITEGILTMRGAALEGEIISQNGNTPVKKGSWLFATTDCGKTFRLVWSQRDSGISGEYVFGPTGYEWPHGANMASAAIYRN